MKIIPLILIESFCLSFLISVFAQNKPLTLTVSAPETSNLEVKVNLPVNGFYFAGNSHSLQLDKNSYKNSLDIPIESQQIITVSNNFREAKFIVKPGDSLNVQFLPTDSLIIRGSNEQGQILLNEITKEDTRFRFEELDSEPTVQGRLQKLKQLEQHDNEKIDNLLNADAITKEFATAIKNESKIYYKLLWSTDIFFTSRELEVESDKAKFIEAWENLYQSIDESWMSSPLYPWLMVRYSSLLNIQFPDNKQNSHPYMIKYIDLLKKKIHGNLLEYAWANLIMMGLGNNENEKEWISNLESFKQQFPNSPLTTLLEPPIKKVAEYQQKQLTISPGVIFIENTDQYGSLKQLFQGIQGKYYYVDLWATWCGPCKEELQWSIKLHEEIEKLGYETIYLSIDDEQADAKWNEMVKGLPLKGLNMRASKTMRAGLKNEITEFLGIPRYLIINDQGEIVEWNAKRPSDGLTLLEQLKSLKK